MYKYLRKTKNSVVQCLISNRTTLFLVKQYIICVDNQTHSRTQSPSDTVPQHLAR